METIWNYITQLAQSNQFLQGGMVLGALTWLGYQLKSVPVFLWNKLRYYVTYTIHFDQSSEFYRLFTEWLNENHPKKFRNVEVKFNSEIDRDAGPEVVGPSADQTKEKFRLCKYQFSDSNTLRYKNRWLLINKDREQINTTAGIKNLFYHSYTVSGLFAKRAIDALCDEITFRKNAEIEHYDLRVWCNDRDYFEAQDVTIVKSLDHIFFAEKRALIADLEQWREQKASYAEKGIKYKRSYLFYGRGGTGKTSLGMALAKYLHYDLYVVNLAGLEEDSDLQALSRRIRKNSVVMLEDIDCILEDREVKNDKLNFSTVLNFLDGLYAPSDCVFVLTTNKPEVLDKALTRKGRVDLALHIDYPNTDEVEAYMSDFYNQDIELPIYSQKQSNAPMSEIQDICLRNETWKDAVNEVMNLFVETNGIAGCRGFEPLSELK